MKNRYVVYFSINGGQSSGRYTGWTNLKEARKDARKIAKGNTPEGSRAFWEVYREDETLGEPIAKGGI